MEKKIIGVFGAGTLDPESFDYQMAFETGGEIARAGCLLLCGGLGGAMEAASRGAKETGGTTIGIMPHDRGQGPPPNPYIDIAIYTGMGEARNVINVKSCHAAIAIGGEYGTLSEIALALKTGCPLILLHSWSFTAPEKQIDAGVILAESPAAAVEKAIALFE